MIFSRAGYIAALQKYISMHLADSCVWKSNDSNSLYIMNN